MALLNQKHLIRPFFHSCHRSQHSHRHRPRHHPLHLVSSGD